MVRFAPPIYVAACLCKWLSSALVILFINLTIPSFAGHYTAASYSGGTYNVGFGNNDDYAMGSAWGCGPAAYGPQSITCSGAITSTFAWVPDALGDNPPDQVVIQETCYANWHGFGTSAAPTGSSNNGLGFAEVTSVNGNNAGGPSSGPRYMIVSGTTSLTITTSPSASDSVPSGQLYANITYSSSAAPVSIDLSGGIGTNWAKRYLIGQQVSAYLETGGLLASYVHWSIVGGKPFSDYVVGDRAVYDNSNPPQLLGYVADGYGLFVPQDGNLTDLTIFYLYAKSESSTVACVAHLDVPAGAKPESGLDVSAVRTCSVEAPSFWHEESIGTAAIKPVPFPGLYLANAVYADPNIGGFQGSGTYWAGSVNTPGDYLATYGDGNWQFTQTLVPDFERTVYNAPKTFSLNATTQIDVRFNYAGQSWTGNNTKHLTDDRPGMPFGSGFSMVHDKMVCQVYMMYKPGGSGSRFVPLMMLNWHWDATAVVNGNGVWTTTANDSPSITPGPNFPDPPQWVRNIIEGVWQ